MKPIRSIVQEPLPMQSAPPCHMPRASCEVESIRSQLLQYCKALKLPCCAWMMEPRKWVRHFACDRMTAAHPKSKSTAKSNFVASGMAEVLAIVRAILRSLYNVCTGLCKAMHSVALQKILDYQTTDCTCRKYSLIASFSSQNYGGLTFQLLRALQKIPK